MDFYNQSNHSATGSTSLTHDPIWDIISIVNFFFVGGPLCLLGMCTNIANIIVYTKMGFLETANVNFLVLSVFDFFYSLFAFLLRACFNTLLRDLSIGPRLRYVSHCVSIAIVAFIGGSAMMTALIATERCICVIFPLKLKTLLTQRRSLCLTLTVVFYHAAFLTLIYSDPGPPYDAHPEKLSFYYFSMYVIPSTTCFFIVIITTAILAIKLRRNQRWRRETTTQGGKASVKEDKLVKTIVAICTLFIICSFPNASMFIAQIVYPPLRYGTSDLRAVTLRIFDLSFIFQSVSASVNIFFYYRMSSKYKKAFSVCFAWCAMRKTNTSHAMKTKNFD
ncbi:hypothetical protein EGW08_006504 [Elysia chlorotica]|uniref:G-protein coupled receptors family 1 profile domain-containing protein n=1 Tax=Elysia chlorotica TaxID=188477 RepID=A0A433TVV4_ELYCH|nr:hypothetical protein EGW08_006504 [Elysia chlorotica]